MRFDYGTQLSPTPIELSIGTLKKPMLKEISNITFEKFIMYEMFLKLTPELFFTKIDEENKVYWDSLSVEQKEKTTLYSLILEKENLKDLYLEILNFFFVESVIFKDDLFILLKNKPDKDDNEITSSNIRGVIHEKIFIQTLELIQQICCIYDEQEMPEENKFKNKLAMKLYDRMLKAQKSNKDKKSDLNLSLPNIISAVSNRHPSINPINIWDLTIFQLLDSFNRLQVNTIYEIDCTRVSVWGDEKKTFDVALWYKNNHDKK